ncbi:NapC/NirT family cytochrome c [uncultured Ferrimonas sp.]|uniref:NapC/NirT family cytochrome c n=1 Tax=uncultured Ferrimonas sp. TaxID=432640 RepID=UPI002627C95C|nr:NapC/NirT family cytochrome c [uncultured Ferrimonas sp.]
MADPERGLWAKPTAWWRFGIPVGGILALALGALGWIGFDASLHWSSSDQFCTSCHNSPSKWVEAEWHQSSHFNNASGVGAGCADCHIPQEFFPKLWVKGTSAMHHVTTQLLGDYQTKDDFEAQRLMLAQRVWQQMEKTDSRECRHCHQVEAMNASAQSSDAAQYHQVLMEQDGPTCIDCHKGIAHQLPQGW